MIVLSAGMQRSGSGYFFNLTNDLLIACGKDDVRELRRRHNLEAHLKHENCLINYKIQSDNITPLLELHHLGKTFVVKTHRPPTEFVRELVDNHTMVVTYIFRDPRDALISAIDQGEFARERGVGPFLKFTTVEKSLPRILRWLKNWEAWSNFSGALLVRYEDLVMKPAVELRRLADHLSLNIEDEILSEIIEKYSQDIAANRRPKEIHFKKGIIGRYKEVLTPEEQTLCNRNFHEYLVRMGYPME